MLRLLAVVASVAACHQAEPREEPHAPAQAQPVKVRSLPPLSGAEALPLLPSLPSGSPPEYVTATKRWRTATAAYAKGDATGAAEAFLGAAEALDPTDRARPEPLARTFAAARCLAYENAARAFAAGGAYARAKDRLEAKQKQDLACRHSIAGALTRVHRAHLAAGPAPLFRPL